MKKNFSKNLQSILKLAKEEAIRLGHSYVGSEHLLIGLLKVKTGTSKKIFELYDVDGGGVIDVKELKLLAKEMYGNEYDHDHPRSQKSI